MPPNNSGNPAIYDIVVFAFQRKNGNTGVDRVTVIVPVLTASNSEGDAQTTGRDTALTAFQGLTDNAAK